MGQYSQDLSVSSGLDELARWVVWAGREASLMQAEGDSHEKAARYNLDQFWKAKAAMFGVAGDLQQDLIKLDMWAHRYWGILENRLVYLTSDPEKRYGYGQQSTAANARAAVLAKMLKQPGAARLVKNAETMKVENSTVAEWANKNMPSTSYWDALADQFKTATGSLGLFGIPWWAYAAGGVALLLVLMPSPPRMTIGRNK